MYNLTGPGGFATPTLDALALAGVRLESYYVHALCSPSRSAFLSGRYAYTTGMNAEVIVDGVPDQLATNIRTLADLLSGAGWATWAGGKWDLGMTTWGCTPTCRGFNNFSGFYNADEEYFSHMVGRGLDLRRDVAPDRSAGGKFSSDVFGDRLAEWITVNAGARNSFAYLAFQAIHAPQQAPQSYLDGHCLAAVAADQPIRRLACAQMASVDANVAKVVAAYKAAGVWDDTLVVFTADNGGNTDTGGNNAPLRGGKATMFEGGLRAASFISGAGLSPAVRGSISHELYSLVDWLPTIAGGVAGVDLALALEPKHAFQPRPPPLDGLDAWASLSTGAPSPRAATPTLLYLDPFNCFAGRGSVPCNVPGQGALRRGRYKVISGHVGTYMSATTNVSTQFCGARDGNVAAGTTPLNATAATTPPFCPAGWVALDGSVRPPPEEAGPAGACSATPCELPPSSPLLAGGAWLFDVVADPTEEHDLAASQPALLAELLAELAAINATNVPQAQSPTDPASDPANFNNVWTPWRGNPDPAACDPNTTAPPRGWTVVSAFDGVSFSGPPGGRVGTLKGWAWSPEAAGGGAAPLNATFVIDGAAVGSAVAVLPRPGVPGTGAPNAQHGYAWAAPAGAFGGAPGTKHAVRVLVHRPDGVPGAPPPEELESRGSPLCYQDEVRVPCGAPR